jgi:hypothetical protein
MYSISAGMLRLLTFLVLLAIWDVGSQAADGLANAIHGVQVGPSMEYVVINASGPLGDHEAFVMKSPHRLVIDFHDAHLGEVPPRIGFKDRPIREIRFGYHGEDARVVFDFGRRTVPAFTIHQEQNYTVVRFARERRSKAREPVSKQAGAEAVTPASEKKDRPSRGKSKPSPYRIESVQVEGDRIILLTRSTGNDESVPRVEVRLATEPLRIRKATAIGPSGAIRELTVVSRESANSAQESGKRVKAPGRPDHGPRKNGRVETVTGPESSSYQWGMPAVQGRVPQPATNRRPFPFRLEPVPLSTSARAR